MNPLETTPRLFPNSAGVARLGRPAQSSHKPAGKDLVYLESIEFRGFTEGHNHSRGIGGNTPEEFSSPIASSTPTRYGTP